jgi:CMP-N,N'-diacetyllegionaminic acid synthase
MHTVLGLITARGGSKGLPQKNIKPLVGKPLIAWTIETALQSRRLSRVMVSTDDEEIAQVARAWGAEVPFMRPDTLAQDDSSHISVVTHVIGWLEEHQRSAPDYIMLLQPTSPLRTVEDIDKAICIAQERAAVAVVSVCAIDRHPYLCKRILTDGTLTDFVSVPTDLTYLRHQDLPPAYTLNGAIYLNRRESLLRDRTFVPPGTVAYIMPPERSLDIDTPWDFYLAELVVRNKYASETAQHSRS